VLALLAGLFVASTMTWWQQANGFEVYSLHCVAMPLVVLMGLRWIDAATSAPARPTALAGRCEGFAFALVTGLSFTNHLTTVLLAPGLITFTLARIGPRRLVRHLLTLVPAFLLGLLPYAWLPFRSAMHPALDWGAPRTWHAFIHHVTGADYQSWLFPDAASVAVQVRYTAWRVPADFAWLGLAVVTLGLVLLAQRQKWIAVLAALSVIAGGLFAAGYRVPDSDPYLLTVVFGLGILFAAGLLRIHEHFGSRAAVACGLALVMANGVLHWRDCDEHGNHLSESFVTDLIGPLPRHAVLFTDHWGQGTSAAWYFQRVEGLRPDVTVVQLDLIRVSWYLDQFARNEPALVKPAVSEFARYRGLLVNAEHGLPYRGREIEAARRALLDAIVRRAPGDRPVFSTSSLPDCAGLARVPYHLAFWLRSDTTYVPESSWAYVFREWRGRIDADAATTCWLYAQSRVDRAHYEWTRGHQASAKSMLASAARFDPHIRAPDVGPLPLAGDRTVLRTVAFFRDLHRALEPVAR